MINFELQTPTRVIFGKDTEKQVGEVIRGYGYQKILLLYGGQNIHKSGLYDVVTTSLRDHGIAFVERGGVKPNPDAAFCEETARVIQAENIELVLAVGGGSVIDCGKVACHAAASGATPWEIMTHAKEITATVPLGVILTIAAAGSETSNSAVITNEQIGKKMGIGTDWNRPLFAIMDPLLTYTLPPYQTACGIVDIMMHTMERYLCKNGDNNLMDRMCEALLTAVIEAGTVAMEKPDDYEARATLMWAGSLSHNGLMGTGRDYAMVAHALEHSLSAFDTKIAHGAGLAVIWPALLAYEYEHDVMRFARMAVRVWGCDMDFEHPERTALDGIRRARAFFNSLGMPSTLQEFGIAKKDLDTIADNCTDFGKNTLANILPLTRDDVRKIYASCLK